jgi:4-hydroxyacetophenone monooxygenase
MTLFRPCESITEDDEAIRRAVEDAHLPSLLAALAHVTGEYDLLREDLQPESTFMLQPPNGLPEGPREQAIALATAALGRFRDAGCPPPAPPDDATLRRILAYLVDETLLDDYLPLLLEELAVSGVDHRAPAWTLEEVAPGADFHVAIVGAGMSGIAAGVRLKQAGIPFVILEKNDDVGGTWYENTYPGCRVDIPNHFYSYSFAQKIDWPLLFSTQGVLLDYFRDCVREFGLREHIRFGVEVGAARFDEGSCTWKIELETADGAETLEANALVSAVGQLNRPKYPDIPGHGRFAGPSFHSAEWDHAVDLKGKRVAVIGTGASAAQFVPVIADEAAHLEVFQRTANWLFPRPDYHEAPPEGMQWLFRHLPHYAQWYRFWLFWMGSEGVLPMVKVDPAWEPMERSVSAANDELRTALTEYLASQVPGDEALLAKIVPPYPPASKRILVDNGAWVSALKRPDVELVTEGIREIDERGVVTEDGRHHEADVILYGTGFQASEFLTPMRITGRGGAQLQERWKGDARAYLGITVPDFPNLFLMYGPNTNIVVNGSIIYFSECEVQYIVGCIQHLLANGGRALDCRHDVHDAYNERVDAGNLQMAWGVSSVNSWYKNATGRVAQNWPFSLLEYWQQTKTPDPDDYEML